MDSDKAYPVEDVGEAKAKSLKPLAPPIQPPYEIGMAKLKESKAEKKE